VDAVFDKTAQLQMIGQIHPPAGGKGILRLNEKAIRRANGQQSVPERLHTTRIRNLILVSDSRDLSSAMEKLNDKFELGNL